MSKVVAITSCSTGIAHTYMAAEALMQAASERGIELRVETQGSIGVEDALTPSEIAAADVVLISANTTVNKDRFIGKRIYETSVDDGIKRPAEVLERALASSIVHGESVPSGKTAEDRATVTTTTTSKSIGGVYRHLMTGVSYMIPLIVAGGICIALSFAVGGINAEGEFAQAFGTIGSSGFALMFAVLSGYIAYSIADRAALAAGLIGGYIASTTSSGFLGALASGFLAGYVVHYLKKWIRLPAKLSGLMPVLVIPLLSSVIVGFLMIFALGRPFTALNEALTGWLTSLSGVSGALLGVIVGAMLAIDMGGPIGKAAYFFAVASLTNLASGETSAVMAAVMAAGMTPPIGLSIATRIAKRKFTAEERETGDTAWVLGISFITEGAIPFAAADPLRVLPATCIGSSITGALVMLFNCGIAVPHGGAFVFFIPGAVSNLGLYILAIVIGSIVTALLVSLFKKTKTPTEANATQLVNS